VDEGGVAQVVEAVVGEDLGARFEPDGPLAKVGGAGALKQLGRQDANSAQQGPAGMDQLQQRPDAGREGSRSA